MCLSGGIAAVLSGEEVVVEKEEEEEDGKRLTGGGQTAAAREASRPCRSENINMSLDGEESLQVCGDHKRQIFSLNIFLSGMIASLLTRKAPREGVLKAKRHWLYGPS